MLGTGLGYFLTVMLGMSVSMMIAYLTVRTLTRGTTFVVEMSPAERNRVWVLREAANELARLSQEFQSAVPERSAAPAPATQHWLREELPERLRALDASLAEAQLTTNPEAQALSAAGERLKILATHPQDKALRDAALAEVQSALDEVEEYLNMPQRRGQLGEAKSPSS